MRVAIRVDVSGQIGTGHLMRCLTLADELAAVGAEACFVMRQPPSVFASLVSRHGHDVRSLPPSFETTGAPQSGYAAWLGATAQEDARATLEALRPGAWDWLVVDHYGIDAEWEAYVRPHVGRLFVIDDLANRAHHCDALLDQNSYAGMGTRYNGLVPEGTALLLGPRFALLRKEFLEARTNGVRARGDRAQRILVFMGGVDADNVTSAVLDAVEPLAGLGVRGDVVIGTLHPDRDAIENRCRALGLQCHVQTDAIASLMASADMAVGAGGTATWERCALGLPTLTLSVADNQRLLTRDCAAAGLVYAPDIDPLDRRALALHLRALYENPSLRTLISQRSFDAVDGMGANRVARFMVGSKIQMRRARWEDGPDLLRWRNTPHVRKVSRNSAVVAEEDHKRWFKAVLEDPNREILIGESRAGPVGVVRFDMVGCAAEISIYLVPGIIGKGLGKHLLRAAEEWLSIERPEIGTVRAEVLRDNIASHMLFQRCGYAADNTEYMKNIKQ